MLERWPVAGAVKTTGSVFFVTLVAHSCHARDKTRRPANPGTTTAAPIVVTTVGLNPESAAAAVAAKSEDRRVAARAARCD